jgi:hypothetical protein
LVTVLTVGWSIPTDADAGIPQSQLQVMFDRMRQDAVFNVDGPLLWGYFFTADDKDLLERAAVALQRRGYRLVRIFHKGSLRDLSSIWILHVERIETHTVESLHRRNQEFYRFARQRKLSSYDGMDVGQVPKSN